MAPTRHRVAMGSKAQIKSNPDGAMTPKRPRVSVGSKTQIKSNPDGAMTPKRPRVSVGSKAQLKSDPTGAMAPKRSRATVGSKAQIKSDPTGAMAPKRSRATVGSKAQNKSHPNKNHPTGANSSVKIVAVESAGQASSDKVRCAYPLENLELASTLEGTAKGVQNAVTGVLDDHGVRWTVPIEKMASTATRLEECLTGRMIDRGNGSRPALKGNLDEAFAELDEGNFGMNKSIFRQEMHKYIFIAGSQLDKLSTGTLLSIVKDLHSKNVKLGDFELGYPARIASSVPKFFDLTETEFKAQAEMNQLTMKKEYVKEGIRYCKDVETFLEEKHKSLKVKGKGGNEDPFKGWAEGQQQEDDLIEAFKKNGDTARLMKIEYVRLDAMLKKYTDELQVDFRTMLINGVIGVRTEKEEEEMKSHYSNSNLNVTKMLVERWKRANGIPVEDSIEIEVSDVPSRKTKAKSLHYVHPLVPNPSIHLAHEPL